MRKDKAKQKICADKWYRDNKPRMLKLVRLNSARYRKAARDFICKYLRKHPCLDCGETDIVVLEFDHVRGRKRMAVAMMLNRDYSIENISKEIEKCDVVCANCHRKRTAKSRKYYRYAPVAQ